jgi:hypothetical protein
MFVPGLRISFTHVITAANTRGRRTHTPLVLPHRLTQAGCPYPWPGDIIRLLPASHRNARALCWKLPTDGPVWLSGRCGPRFWPSPYNLSFINARCERKYQVAPRVEPLTLSVGVPYELVCSCYVEGCVAGYMRD